MVFSLQTSFTSDEIAIYENALDFFLTGKLHGSGAAVVYSGTALPGSLLPLLSGVPLFITKGLPAGSVILVAILSLLAAWLTFRLYQGIFPRLEKSLLAIFILFAPWSILYTNLWNPSYLPFFSVLFFFGIFVLMKKPKDFFASFLISFSILCTFQLHLSFVLLIIFFATTWLLRFIRFPNWKGLTLGTLLGGLPLIPYFTNLLDKKDSSGDFLSSNIELHAEAWMYLPKIFFRFVSFPTGETTRFLSSNGGPAEAWKHLSNYFFLWPFYIVGILVSIWLILVAVSFYVDKKRIRTLKRAFKDPHSLNSLEKIDVLVFLLPIITWIPFFFSIKGPSAHTFWIFMPLSFYPLLRAMPKWDYLPFSFEKPVAKRFAYVMFAYILSANIYSLVGFSKTPTPKVKTTQEMAQKKFPDLNLLPEERKYGQGIHAIYRALYQNDERSEY